MQHFTFSGETEIVDGEEFRFSAELGRRVGASRSGWLITSRKRTPHHGNCRGPAGYYGVTIDGHSVYIHRLVYELFVDRVPDGMEIDHINTNPRDNRAENLRVVTKSGNMRNPITRRRNLAQLGTVRDRAFTARRRQVCVSWQADGRTKTLYKFFESVTAASKFTEVDRTSIAKVCTGRRRSAKGFKFQYVDAPEGTEGLMLEVEGDICDRYHK